MIYLFCRRRSASARAIVATLRAQNRQAARGIQPPEGALVLNWGSAGTFPFLNGNLVLNKLRQLERLKEAGVNVPDWNTQPQGPDWYARRFHHQEANDLLANLRRGDYYVKHVPTEEEWRVHVVKGRSIRAGKKIPREGVEVHPVFRSWTGGWRLSYVGSPQWARQVAYRAIEALGYDFGAVDLAMGNNGQPVVWEVNSAPGLEGGTITAYAAAFAALEVDR